LTVARARDSLPGHWQAVEKQRADAARDGCGDETGAQAIVSSGASPDMCRIRDLKNVQGLRSSTTCYGADHGRRNTRERDIRKTAGVQAPAP
jgi:hypothetical protein